MGELLLCSVSSLTGTKVPIAELAQITPSVPDAATPDNSAFEGVARLL